VLVAQLGGALHSSGDPVPSVALGEYNQLHQTCLDPDSPMGVEGVLSKAAGAFDEVFSGCRELIAFARTLPKPQPWFLQSHLR